MASSSLKIEFTDKEITAWGGMALLKKLIEKTGINDALSLLPLPQQGSNRGYDPIQLINHFWVSIWCGANRFEHLEITRYDGVIQQLFGWTRMAGHKAFARYFKKFSHARNHRVFTGLYQWFFGQLLFDNFTLDLDSTVMTRYGDQEGAAVGYNPSKRGRKSHHPLMAFVSECRMVANVWLRPGNTSAANNVFSFLSETLSHLEGKVIGLLRADSGFHAKRIFEWLERPGAVINYIISMKFYPTVQRFMAGQSPWVRLDDGIEIADAIYQPPDWPAARRLVIVRQHVALRPKASGKQLSLFADEVEYRKYRYGCFITNLTLPAHQVWVLYRGRSDAENRIKELKYDFGAGSFNLRAFYPTETAMHFVMMAYNLMSLFRQVVLRETVQSKLSTLRYKVLAIGSYMVRNGNQRVLKMSLVKERREWFTGLWTAYDSLTFPHPVPT
jgi:hypothetical protein